MRIAFLLIFLPSCITIAELPTRKAYIDSRAKPYVDSFVKDYKAFAESHEQHNIDPFKVRIEALTVNIEPMNEIRDGKRVLGVCTYDAYGMPFIVLNESYWYYSTDSDREELLYHELGHCVLDQDHRDYKVKLGNDTLIGSTMNSIKGVGATYKKYKAYYLNELFTAKRGIYGGCNLIEATGKSSTK